MKAEAVLSPPSPLTAPTPTPAQTAWSDMRAVARSNLKSATVDALRNQHDLSFLQKVLLTTDGTVTQLLMLHTGKQIWVNKLEQRIDFAGPDEAFLCPRDTPILKRRVLLHDDRRNYVYAESLLIFENLSRSIQYQLLETDRPIGLMWREEKTETYRQIIGYKREANPFTAAFFDVPAGTHMPARFYYIHHDGKLLGIIMETFPITLFT